MTSAPAPDGLGRAAAGGALRALAGQVARTGLQLLGIVVLARLLTPREYGLVAMVAVVVAAAELVRDVGLSAAAVQARTLSTAQRDGLLWLGAGAGAVAALLVVALSGAVADLYDEPVLRGVAQGLAPLLVLNGVATQYRAGLVRDLRFGRLAVCDVTAQAVGLAAAVAHAAAGGGYRALVTQQLVQAVVALVLVALSAGWLPGRPRRGAGLRGLVAFGGAVAASQALGWAAKNLDTLIIGLRSGPAALGGYTRAYQLVMTPLVQVLAPTTTVAVPVLSRLQDDPERAGRYLLRGQAAFGLTVVAGLGLVAGAAEPLVAVLLGARWDGTAPLLTALAVAGACEALPYVGYWTYLSRRLPRALLRFTAESTLLRCACLLAGAPGGAVGVAVGYAAGSLLNVPFSLWRLSRVTPLPLRALLLGAGRALLLAALAAVAGRGAVALVPGVAAELAAAVLAGAAVYALALGSWPAVRADAADLRALVRAGLRRRTAAA